MNKVHELLRRLRMLFYRGQFQADLEEEVRLHLELRERELTEKGVDSSESRRAAYRRFGNPTSIKEKSYMAWGWGWLESLVQDARFALRQLWKTPGFTVTVVPDAGAGDWRECGDLHAGESGAAEEPAGGRPEGVDPSGRSC